MGAIKGLLAFFILALCFPVSSAQKIGKYRSHIVNCIYKIHAIIKMHTDLISRLVSN